MHDDDDEDFVYVVPITITDASAIAEVYMQQVERAEFIRAVAAGVPASEVHAQIRHRKKLT